MINRLTLYPGVKAFNKKNIGNLKANTLVKVIVADENKISIEVTINRIVRTFYLETPRFLQDFELSKNSFQNYEFPQDTKSISTSVEDYKPDSFRPHSSDYLYTSFYIIGSIKF